MKDRLLQLLKAENMTPKVFADALGVRPSNISHLLSGRNNPGYDFITNLLIKFPNINPDWLLLGQGGIYRDTNIIDKEVDLRHAAINIPVIEYPSIPDMQRDAVSLTDKPSGYKQQDISSHYEKNIPLQESNDEITFVTDARSQADCNDKEGNGTVDSMNDGTSDLITNVTSEVERIVIFYRNHKFTSYEP